jgi:hypothetical protein
VTARVYGAASELFGVLCSFALVAFTGVGFDSAFVFGAVCLFAFDGPLAGDTDVLFLSLDAHLAVAAIFLVSPAKSAAHAGAAPRAFALLLFTS